LEYAVIQPAVFEKHAGADFTFAFAIRVGSEGTGPGDVTMAGGIEGVVAFVKGPAGAGVDFTESEIVGGDVLLASRETLFGDGELVHESEAEIGFGVGKVDLLETSGELGGGFPTDLAAEAGFVAGGFEVAKVIKEDKEDGFQEMPIFGPGGEEGAEPEFGAFDFVDVDDGEVALAGSGDVEAETELGRVRQEGPERIADELADLRLALLGGVRGEFAEAAEDIVGFEVEAFDFVIGTAAFDSGPIDDVGGSGAHGIAHIGLLEDFVGAGARAGVGEELVGSEAGALDAIDGVEEAELDGVGDGDAVVEVPGAVRS